MACQNIFWYNGETPVLLKENYATSWLYWSVPYAFRAYGDRGACWRGRRIYDLYTDYVLKNPFYEVEMPVRCELFDQNLLATIGMLHRRWGVVQT